MKNFPYIEEGNKRINQLTGAEFGFLSKLVEEGTFKMNSKDAWFSALRSLAPHRLLEFTSAMQKRFIMRAKV